VTRLIDTLRSLLLAAACACSASAARAEAPRVLFLEPSPARPALAATLQIQLLGLAELVSEPDPSGARPQGERIAAASALARGRGLLAVVWTEPPVAAADGSQTGVLYVVGVREGRALVEVLRVPASAERDPAAAALAADRTLALKLRELVSELVRAARQAPDAAMLLPPPAARDSAPPAQAAAEPEPPPLAATPQHGLRALVSAGPRLALQPKLTRLGFGLGGGPSWSAPRWRLSAQLGLDYWPTRSQRRDALEVRFSELWPRLRLGAQLRRRWFWLGVSGGAALVWVDATGVARTGQAQDDLLLFAAHVGLDFEVALSRRLGLGASVELQSFVRRQSLAVNGQAIVDLGRVR
jgi:hypothetical protein